MSKEFKNMDDLFQSAFADEVTEVPAFVKTNIDKKLGFDRKKNFGSMLPILLLTAILAVGIIYFTTDDTHTILTKNNLYETNTTTTPSTEIDLNSSTNNTEKNTSLATNTSQINSSENSNLEVIESTLNSSSTNNYLTSKKDNNFDKKDDSKKINSDGKVLDATSDPNQTTDLADASISNPSNNFSDDKTTDDSKVDDNSTADNPKSVHDSESEFTSTDSNQEGEKKLEESPADSVLIENNRDTTNAGIPVDDTPEAIVPPVSIEPRKKYNPWMLSLTGGMNLTKSKYTSPNQTEIDLYTNSTNSKPSFETNFEAKYRLKNSLTFGSGLGLSQFSENYNFSKNTFTYDSTLIWTYVYDSLDTTLFPPPIDSSYTVESYDSTQINLYNATGETNATYIHLPISIGTQIIRNKFRFDFYAMARFNYLVSTTGGYILDDAFVSFTKNNNPIFKPWYIDMMLGATVHYNLIGKLYVSGTFRYRPPIGQMYQGTSFNKSLQYTHIGIGLSLKL